MKWPISWGYWCGNSGGDMGVAVAGTLMVLACRLSTRSAGVSYSLVPSSWLQLCTIHLQASSKRQQRDTPQATRSQTGLQSQGYTTHTANTHWNAQRPHCTNRFPQGVFNDYRTIQMIHYKFPCSATNLSHYIHYWLALN